MMRKQRETQSIVCRTLLPTVLMVFMYGMAYAAPVVVPLPSTFNITIENGLLCLDQLDINYYYNYLADALGPPYKHADGAYWFKFKSKVKLWNVPVSEILVSDGNGTMLFLAATADVTPEKLEQAIEADAGISYIRKDASAYPRRASSTGSDIIYFHNKAKIYCGKSQYLLPHLL